jgi:putative addiction module killer protein
MEYHVKVLELENGRCPFERWFSALRDKTAIARIRARLVRVRDGNLGDIRTVGGGVSELRIDYGPGNRIYLAFSKEEIVVLVNGGDKTTQQDDIEMAQKLWRENKDAAERFQRDFRLPTE